ncbi:MAG: cell envelope integrity protein CreD [bacterium]|nr:cell envelope integrity protein CreD [bacterium]
MESQFNQIRNSIKGSITLKLISIGAVILILLIPKSHIESLIYERQGLRNEAIMDISSKWGLEQTIKGPIVSIPYWCYEKIDKEVHKIKKYAYFLPEKYNVNGELKPESRYRGIHEVVVYQSELMIDGEFSKPDFSKLNILEKDILWNEAQLQFGISDLRGINESIEINWDGAKQQFSPGLSSRHIMQRGLNTPITFTESKNYQFKFDLSINGSSNISFIPVGAETKVLMKSSWKDPSFTGNLLPRNRKITTEGFVADWSVLNLNRPYPQQWKGAEYQMDDSQFGVNLFIAANEYQKSTRSAKYALLILFLTFITYFLVEVLGKKKIHPVQYGIVGLALIIFYTLLLSISEYLSFNFAYGIAALVIIVSIAGYSASIFQSAKRGVSMGGFLSLVYFFIFIILQSQDFSLLIGSIGLFVTLVAVMYFSRNVNWYNLKLKASENNHES